MVFTVSHSNNYYFEYILVKATNLCVNQCNQIYCLVLYVKMHLINKHKQQDKIMTSLQVQPAGLYFDALCHGPLSPDQSFHTLSVHYDSVVYTAERILFRYKISTPSQPKPTHADCLSCYYPQFYCKAFDHNIRNKGKCASLCQIAIKKC